MAYFVLPFTSLKAAKPVKIHSKSIKSYAKVKTLKVKSTYYEVLIRQI